jgi:DNA-binding GntR family transcriptional regulator
VLDYRIAVETGVVVLAAERATVDDLARLDDLTDRMAATEGARFQAYRRADVRFHIGMAEACHSPRLVAAMTEVQGHMTDLIERIAHPDVVLSRANAQHRRMIALLRRRDVGGAVQLMREHCAGTEHILAGLMPEA